MIVLGLAGASPAGALTVKAPVKFGLPAYGTTISFLDNVVANRIALRSENITLENFRLENGTYVAPSQLFSVENDNMTVNTSEEDLIEFDLQGTLVAWVRLSSGGRAPPRGVTADGVTLTEKASLAVLQAADNGWYFDDNIVHVKVQGPKSARVDFSPAQWQLIESWTGTIEAPAAWQLIETWTGTVRALLASRVDAISPYWLTSTSFTITVTAPAAVDNVALYYRYSTDNSTWGSWTSFGTDNDNSDGWSWSFTADNGDGYYEFYSIASSAGLVEPAPARADARCGIDTVVPSITSFLINGGASETTSTSVTLSISASDNVSGVYQMRFQNEGESWSSWEAYSTSKSWTLTSGDGTKTVYAKVRDYALNESATASDSITKTTPSPPPTPPPPPPPTGIITISLGPLVAGESVEVDLSALGVFIRVVLIPAENVESGWISVQKFENRPTGLPAPLGVPYVYADFSANFTIENATIEFYVERSWVNLNNVNDNTIRMNRYTAENWQELPTDKTDENSTHLFYLAVTPGFSIFTITGQLMPPTPVPTTYALALPPEPVTTPQTTIKVYVSNPTASLISKRCEFRIGELLTVSITLTVGANENKEIPLTLDVTGIQGTYAVELWDLDEGQTLATGTITLAPPAPAPPAPPGLPILFIAAMLAAAICLVAAAVLRVRRLPARRAPEGEREPSREEGEGEGGEEGGGEGGEDGAEQVKNDRK